MSSKKVVSKKTSAKKAPAKRGKNSSSLKYGVDAKGRHHWQLFSRNGRVVAQTTADGYATKLGAQRSWEAVCTAVEDAEIGKLNVA